jgi:hypothetical protein
LFNAWHAAAQSVTWWLQPALSLLWVLTSAAL